MAEYFTKDGDEYKKVEEKLLTQSQMEYELGTRLERDRKKFADYDALKEKASKVDTISKEYEDKLKQAGEKHTELEKQLGSAKLETEKVKIINEFKLSDDLGEFVTGDTADDMRKKAEKLAKGFTGGTPNIDKKQKPEGDASSSKDLAKKLFGGASSD